MGYRDESDGLRLELTHLESENERLRSELADQTARYEQLVRQGHEIRRDRSRVACVMCGGSLHPVALFAGHSSRNPVPLQVSTLRFGSPTGGFTHAAGFHTLACASCGFLHNFLAFDEDGPPPGTEG